MPGKFSYKHVRRLARIWFGEAREQDVPDEADAALPQQWHKWNSHGSGSGDKSPGSFAGERCDGRGGGD